jgi:hypothetical protein
MHMDLIPFFVRRDMAFARVGQDGISSGFTTNLPDEREQDFVLFVLPIEDGFGDRYVRFTIVPYIEQPSDGYANNLYHTIAQINHDLPQLKFAVDDDGDLELIFDVPQENLDDAQFGRALQILADYASAYYIDLLARVPGTSLSQ